MLTAMLAPASASTAGNPRTGAKSGPAVSAKADTGNPTAGSSANAAKNHPAPSARTASMPRPTTSFALTQVSGGCVAASAASVKATTPPATSTASRRRRCRAALSSAGEWSIAMHDPAARRASRSSPAPEGLI